MILGGEHFSAFFYALTLLTIFLEHLSNMGADGIPVWS